MRSKAIAFATGAVLGCSSEPAYQWGMPYQPGIGEDEDDEDDPSSDEEASADSGDDGPPPSSDADSGGATTSGIDPSISASATVADESGSTGEPGDSADTGESPYQGGWDVGNCQDEMVSDVADFYLTDSYGDQIRLYDFCHKAIMLTAGSFW